MTSWLNGEIVSEPLIPASNAGALLGWGVFTTFGIEAGQPVFLSRHVDRLRRDATTVGLNLPFEHETLETAVHQLLGQNPIKNGLGRITLTASGDGFWSDSTGTDTSITVKERTALSRESSLLVSGWHPSPTGPLIGAKTTSYLPYYRAWSTAKSEGFEDALLINSEGHLCETARSNLFWLTGEMLFTPALAAGCLRGIGREVLIECAKALNLTLEEGQFNLAELHAADEVFTVSAAAGPRHVSEVKVGDELWVFRERSILPELLQEWGKISTREK